MIHYDKLFLKGNFVNRKATLTSQGMAGLTDSLTIWHLLFMVEQKKQGTRKVISGPWLEVLSTRCETNEFANMRTQEDVERLIEKWGPILVEEIPTQTNSEEKKRP